MGKRQQYDFDEDLDDMGYRTAYRSQVKRKRNHKLKREFRIEQEACKSEVQECRSRRILRSHRHGALLFFSIID